jgi:hypothetical protein
VVVVVHKASDGHLQVTMHPIRHLVHILLFVSDGTALVSNGFEDGKAPLIRCDVFLPGLGNREKP